MPVLPLEPRDPREVGPHRLLGRLGEGGQGTVYLAEDAQGRRVAVKMLKLDGLSPGADGAARRQLGEEVHAAMRVAPFCTARILGSSLDGPAPYVVSQYVAGPSLYERVELEGPLDEDALIRLMIQSVSGLTAIHGARIVHRDLKPSNLLLGPDGARVVDFGIARPIDARTATGRLIGTPPYFSPEQLAGKPATMASDVFAWAGTMVFAATGRAPFGHADYHHEMPALFRRIMDDEPDLAGVPEAVVPLLLLCMDKAPERRPGAWGILEWLLPPAPAQVPDASPPAPDPFTEQAIDLIDRVEQIGPPVHLPPPGPPPAENAPPWTATPPPMGPPSREVSLVGPPPSEASPVNGTPPGGGTPSMGDGTAHTGGTPIAGTTSSAVGGLSNGGAATDPSLGEGLVGGGPVTVAPGGREKRRSLVWVAAALGAVVVAGVAWVLVPGGGGETPSRTPEQLGGTWRGQVSESDGFRNHTSDVTLSLPEGEDSGILTGSRCAGGLAVVEVGGERMELGITSGPCTDGTVVVRRVGDGLDVQVRGGGSATGNGTLTRSGA